MHIPEDFFKKIETEKYKLEVAKQKCDLTTSLPKGKLSKNSFLKSKVYIAFY